MLKILILSIIVYSTNNVLASNINDVAINTYKVTTNSMKTGQKYGSAFSVGKYIITNKHVVNGADKIRLKNVLGEELETNIIHISKKYDLAIVDNVFNSKGIDLCLNSNINIMSNIYNLGNPGAEDFIITKGYISGQKRMKPFFGTNNLFLVHNLIGTGGQSGSALMDFGNECAVGVITGALVGTYIGYSIPVETLKQYISDYEKNNN